MLLWPEHIERVTISVTTLEIVQVLVKPLPRTTSTSIVRVFVNPTTTTAKSYTSTTTTTITKTYTTSIPSPTSTNNQFNQTFADSMLTNHNEKRRLHGSQMLKWNDDLYQYAQNYVNEYDCSGILTHSGGPYGENIALGYSPIGAINGWYDEGNDYQYGSETIYNHFTALVWNNTNSIGCAYKYCNSVWNDYIVCSYNPPGNVIGQCSANVFPIIISIL
ncbi:probable pathogenesis-related protein CaO19.2336 [[Candida] anglica]|uniref:Probable pathogenesis-related protein CaO19.2336 n=1 Tax=[Candida] anglica TaxID=148631 RepID=A0ABP0E8S5_9ASCO